MVNRANIKNMSRVPLGIAQAVRLVGGFRPDVVLTTGGYVSVPVGVGAWLRRVPLVMHEQTVRLGLANRLLARIATYVAVSSETTVRLLPQSAHTVVTGNPVRPEILHGHADKAINALGLQGFDRDLPTIYVTGGAQGAVQINTVVRDLLPWLLARANVIHQCGSWSTDELSRHAPTLDAMQASRYFVTEFVGPELADVFAWRISLFHAAGPGRSLNSRRWARRQC
jgi:UDP-N-acetylglucosamine--N-acetylmuramyl-(pentapeptide) pyrophosphoryl-undecaprenol N-acetylglucosamine transferase